MKLFICNFLQFPVAFFLLFTNSLLSTQF